MLKSGAKQTTGQKKRKKVPLLGTFAQYNDSKKKPAPQKQQTQITDTIMLAPLPTADPTGKEDLRKKK